VNISDDKSKIATVDALKTDEGSLKDVPEVTIRYQYDNHLGSASLELDDSANLITYEEYHPFGTTSYRSGRTESETSLKRYKYVGKERDEETGLYYYGARYYAAWICRFVSVDSLQFDYPYYTPFQYAGNKPISNIDIDGLEEWYFMKEIHKGIGVWQKSNVVSGPFSADLTEKLNSVGYYNRDQISNMYKQYLAEEQREKDRAERVKLHKFKQYLNMDQTRPENNPVFGALQAIYSMTLEAPVASVNDFSNGRYGRGTYNAICTVLMMFEMRALSKLASGASTTYKSAKFIDDLYEISRQESKLSVGVLKESARTKAYNKINIDGLPGEIGINIGTKRLSDDAMRELTSRFNVEFAQVYVRGKGANGSGGYYKLFSGTIDQVKITGLNKDVIIINHTHPSGTLFASPDDRELLKLMESLGSPQRSSIVIPSNGKAHRFNKHGVNVEIQ
ncbi:MAG: hypothetical protein N4A72_11555, partial [Bacteroidales bacterium]|nr:hypothetical protein [Bacteroidales bacterium]